MSGNSRRWTRQTQRPCGNQENNPTSLKSAHTARQTRSRGYSAGSGKNVGEIFRYTPWGAPGAPPGGIPPVSTTNNPYVNTRHRAASGLSPLRTANRTFNANSLRSNPARPARLRNTSSAFRLITTTTKHLNVLDRVFAAERVRNNMISLGARRSATVSVVEDRVAAWAVCDSCCLGLSFGLRCDAFPFAGPGA